jgi:hypothetical protein
MFMVWVCRAAYAKIQEQIIVHGDKGLLTSHFPLISDDALGYNFRLLDNCGQRSGIDGNGLLSGSSVNHSFRQSDHITAN